MILSPFPRLIPISFVVVGVLGIPNTRIIVVFVFPLTTFRRVDTVNANSPTNLLPPILFGVEFVIIACIARFGNDPNRITIGSLAHFSRHAIGESTRRQVFRTLANSGFATARTRLDRIPSRLSDCIFFALLERLSKTRILALGA